MKVVTKILKVKIGITLGTITVFELVQRLYYI